MHRAGRTAPASLFPTRYVARSAVPIHRPRLAVAGRYTLRAVGREPLPAPVFVGVLPHDAPGAGDVGVVVVQGSLSLDLVGAFVAILTIRVVGEGRDELRTRFVRGRYEVDDTRLWLRADDGHPLGEARLAGGGVELDLDPTDAGEPRTYRFAR